METDHLSGLQEAQENWWRETGKGVWMRACASPLWDACTSSCRGPYQSWGKLACYEQLLSPTAGRLPPGPWTTSHFQTVSFWSRASPKDAVEIPQRRGTQIQTPEMRNYQCAESCTLQLSSEAHMDQDSMDRDNTSTCYHVSRASQISLPQRKQSTLTPVPLSYRHCKDQHH